MNLIINDTLIKVDDSAAQEIVRRHLQGHQASQLEQFEEAAMVRAHIGNVALDDGERVIGTYGGPDGKLTLAILRPEKKEDVTWDQAIAFARDLGYDAPNREEGLLLFRHHRDQFKKDDVLWLNEQRADASSYAWHQNFNGGAQYYWPKDYKLLARAVRRVAI